MKKILSFFLVLSMLLAMTACGTKTPKDDNLPDSPGVEEPENKQDAQLPEAGTQPNEEESNQQDTPQPKPEKPVQTGSETKTETPSTPAVTTPTTPTTPSEPEKPAQTPSTPSTSTPSEPSEPSANATVGQQLLARFKQVGGSGTAEEIAEKMIEGDLLPFAPATAPREEGFLSGFREDITGFSEAAVFCPIIGTIPFMGYIFKLPAGADVNAFISDLKSKANLRWNVCTSADEMVTGHIGQTVFFVMCPSEFED